MSAAQAFARRLQAFLSADGGQQSGEELADVLTIVLTIIAIVMVGEILSSWMRRLFQ